MQAELSKIFTENKVTGTLRIYVFAKLNFFQETSVHYHFDLESSFHLQTLVTFVSYDLTDS